jgi:hypothetical protein
MNSYLEQERFGFKLLNELFLVARFQNLQSAICNPQPDICNLTSATCNLQPEICNLQPEI